jgi:hypothetical protein
MLIEEGRLIEKPCPDCGHVERRAFGEVETDRGELASYALGWTSGHEDRVGYLTIGIGAGNAGGGSFHVEYRDLDDGPGMLLVDRPFEDVPEGGPDLTRDEALAHEDLDFVWVVADEVMLQDRRAWWMEHYVRATGAVATDTLVDGAVPVQHVVRDDDGIWQLLCATPGSEEHANSLHLYHAVDRDQTLLEVLDLKPGERADRDEPGAAWQRSAA